MLETPRFDQIDAMAAVGAVNATLRRIDRRLIDHGERVAFLSCALREVGGLPLSEKELFLLGVFHDIGAYKTDEIDRMVEFETHDVLHHSIYGYLFLKYLTPLRDYAEAVLYHHTPWSDEAMRRSSRGGYGALLHLADRLDIALLSGKTDAQVSWLLANASGVFRDEDVAALRCCWADGRIQRQLADGSYRDINRRRCASFLPRPAEALEYLKMVVYAIDFRSEQTVTHTVNTVSLALHIADHFGLDRQTQESLYLGALLHDVGKIAISSDILEYPGRLSDAQMAIMRTHVNETESLIGGVVPEEICQIAVRHHEKLDGSGYPRGLRGAELTFPQRIVAVADIVSALGSRRSYKDAFPKDKTLSILQQMEGVQLDASICRYVREQYDAIMADTEPARTEVIRQYRELTAEFTALAAQHGRAQ